jgi:hypothetical protein
VTAKRQAQDPTAGVHAGKSRSGRLLAGLLVAVASLLLSLSVAEVLARWLLGAPPKPYPVARFDNLLLVNNSQHFRDFEYLPEKPPGVFRIVALGDSFTEGQGVDFDDIWPKRLERYLNEYRGEKGVRYEVLDLALSGTSTPHQLRILREVGLRHRPDLVVLGYCLNDPEDEDDHRTLEISPRHIFKDYGSRGRLGRWLSRHSALYRLVVGRLRNTRINSWTLRYYRDIYREDYSGWKKTRAALEEFAKLRGEGLPVAVMMFPLFSWNLDESYPLAYAHEAVRKTVEAAGLPLLDLFPIYRGQEQRLLEAVPDRDPHPNDVAHRLAAEELIFWLDQRSLLPGGPSLRFAGAPRRLASPY